MLSTTLVIPGLHGSGREHWQSWLERRVPDAIRVEQTNWEEPILARWSGKVRRQIDCAKGNVWIVAHSFGCLAAVVAAYDRRERVAGALLVAPADPERFTPLGVRREDAQSAPDSISNWLPDSALGFPAIVVASSNDPWVRLTKAVYWADRWGSLFVNIGAAGHINVEAGFGPWPEGLQLFQALREAQRNDPLGSFSEPEHPRKHSVLARLRHHTRLSMRASVGAA